MGDTFHVNPNDAKNNLSNTQIAEEFYPIPYTFVLKDALGDEVNLSPTQMFNAEIECPPFHILLDHLVAVLWCFYSKKNQDLLGSAQLHWALKTLEGNKNSRGQHSEDVLMAIEDLQDAYLNICARIDIESFQNRKHSSSFQANRTVISFNHQDENETGTNEVNNYTGFEGYLNASQQTRAHNSKNLNVSSLLLADMLENEKPANVNTLLDTEEEDCFESSRAASKIRLKEFSRPMEHAYLVERNNKFRDVIDLLNEIKRLDAALEDLRNYSSTTLNKKLKEIINKKSEDQ